MVYNGQVTKGKKRELARLKRKHGMRVDGAGVRKVQLALLDKLRKAS